MSKAISISDIKTIIAYSTISQISYMFIALLINPFLTLYHIIIHALFKALLSLISGSLIHIQYHYQSINNLKINHTFIKLISILSGSVLILSLSKETIIYSSILLFSSIFIDISLTLGTIYTILYTSNIYIQCFYFNKSINLIKQSHIYYSFIILFSIISSIFLDIISEYSISLNVGTQFYSIDYQTYFTYIIINEHYTIICVFINVLITSFYYYYILYYYYLFNSISSSFINIYNYNLTIHSIFKIPIYQDLFILISSYFIKGPINLLEVMSCLNYCYNLYHIHYFNIIFIIYLLLSIIILLSII